MREFLIRILKGAVENWLISLLTAGCAAVGGWLLWLCRGYLKDWLLSTRYVEMPGWAWVVTIAVIMLLPLSFFWLITENRRGKRGSREDFKNHLKTFLKKKIDSGEKEFLFKLDGSDKIFGVDKDTAKQLLIEVATDCGMKMDGIGDSTVRFVLDYDEQTHTV